MCGIIGYIGKQQATPILIEGLRRLEYRGYDSAGVAVLQNRELSTRKKKGKIDEGLAKLVQTHPIYGQVGMGHTVGPPTAHPPTRTPTRTSTSPANSPSSTTA